LTAGCGDVVPFAYDEGTQLYDRHAYPFVALVDRAVHVFSTQDVCDPAKAGRGESFTYSFRSC